MDAMSGVFLGGTVAVGVATKVRFKLGKGGAFFSTMADLTLWNVGYTCKMGDRHNVIIISMHWCHSEIFSCGHPVFFFSNHHHPIISDSLSVYILQYTFFFFDTIVFYLANNAAGQKHQLKRQGCCLTQLSAVFPAVIE